MPSAPLRPCAGGCGVLVKQGRCPACALRLEQRRGTAHQRGYDRAWINFRPRYFALLVEAGIVPVCGAALPTGPEKRDSACRDAGLLTFASADDSSLHLDHEPKLEEWERRDVSRVCDERRIVLKCSACHSAKTGREG